MCHSRLHGWLLAIVGIGMELFVTHIYSPPSRACDAIVRRIRSRAKKTTLDVGTLTSWIEASRGGSSNACMIELTGGRKNLDRKIVAATIVLGRRAAHATMAGARQIALNWDPATYSNASFMGLICRTDVVGKACDLVPKVRCSKISVANFSRNSVPTNIPKHDGGSSIPVANFSCKAFVDALQHVPNVFQRVPRRVPKVFQGVPTRSEPTKTRSKNAPKTFQKRSKNAPKTLQH